MAQLSYNSLVSKRSGLGKIIKGLLLLIIIALVYVAGYLTPTIRAKQTYAPAEAKAKQFVAHILAGEYNAAVTLGTDSFKEQYKDEALLQEAIGNLKTDKPEFKKAETVGYGDYFKFSQVVDGLPANEEGLTDAGFNIDLVKIDGEWQIVSVFVI